MRGIFTAFFILATASLSAQAPIAKEEKPLTLAQKYPSLRVQASVGTRTRPVPGSSYMKTMVISPTVVIESAQTQPMNPASLTCLLITMNTREKYVSKDQVCKIAATETLGVPAVSRGARRKFEFQGMQTRFDSDRDTSNVGGEVFKYFILGMLSDDQQFLHFETNCPGLDRYLKAHPEERKKYLSLKVGESFSSKFPN